MVKSKQCCIILPTKNIWEYMYIQNINCSSTAVFIENIASGKKKTLKNSTCSICCNFLKRWKDVSPSLIIDIAHTVYSFVFAQSYFCL